MSLDTKHSILKAIHDISQMNVNDVLVDVNNTKVFETDFDTTAENNSIPYGQEILSILKKTNEFQRETGTNTFCLAIGIIEWEIKSKAVQTPILIIPIQYKQSKIKQVIDLNFDFENAFINPFLINYLSKEFEIQLPFFEANLDLPFEFQSWLKSVGISFKYHLKQFIGNFHHHRYQIVKDLEGLLELDEIGDNVEQILGNEDKSQPLKLDLALDNLFPTDNDQLIVFEEVKNNNTVIQGPPGTGKSQVLSNLLGKILISSSKALVVSEKRGALQVLQNKLAEFNLDDFTFVTTSETVSNDFIKSLKKVWDRLEINSKSRGTINLKLSEQLIQNLQLQLNLLNQKELIGGVNFDEFLDLKKNIDFSKTIFISDAPTINEWKKDKEFLAQIYTFNLNKSIEILPFEVVKNDGFISFDLKIKEWKKDLNELKSHFKIEKYSDLAEAIKQAVICQVIDNELNKPYFNLLIPNSNDQKRYNTLKKRKLALLKKVKVVEEESKNWKIEPSENEAKQLLESIKSATYFKKRKAKKRIAQLLNSTFVEPISALTNWIEFLKLKQELSQLTIEFSEIGIDSMDVDTIVIDHFIQNLDKKEWEIYTSIEPEKRKILCQFHSKLSTFQSVLKSYFKFHLEDSIEEVFERVLTQFEDLIRLRSIIILLNNSNYRLIGKVISATEFSLVVLKSNWVKFESHFPELAKFKSEDIHSKIDQIIESQEEESVLFSKQIEEKISTTFQEFHRILRTPSQKLTQEEKLKKQQLKKGKSILVKEFSKTKSHPSIRELLQSEASIWIHLLKPIWLSNPVQVARCFPLEKDFFDFVIFDESSQITLSSALGSLHRGKRIVVAGDAQQMSPTLYFKGGNSETIDLLHQAGFYWKNAFLKHHYRSIHPALIEFSNKHFYQNSLIAYPSGVAIENPIHFHYCENGIFEDRKNTEEAKLVAQIIEDKIKTSISLGIVAFSETQLNCIYENLSPSILSLIADKIESGTVFFKALENVQGEECDHLIISLGYSKNKEGEFQMRFGPLNQKNGSKRLNVLLTRARKSIDFVASVTSKDFKISENESINLLRLFLIQIEKNKTPQKINFQFPFDLQPIINQKSSYSEVNFSSIYSYISDARELVTFQRVLKNRNWKIK